MISINTFRKLALSLPEATELPHFEKTSFRVAKKIFATLDIKSNMACIKLSEIDQSVFTAFDSATIYAVPNKWGKQGWTYIELKKVRKDILTDALKTAYCQVAPKHLSAKVRPEQPE
ncbi:MAG: MmcQ/YjbR family DNA-binding protein [Bacteroidia bacterium]|jgi:predicted DNA-binding protein (MmcQ/YjbR family)